MKKIILLLIFACTFVWQLSAQTEPEIIEENGKKFLIHTVKKDETVWSISQKYKVTPAVVYQHNPKSKTRVIPGERIKIPHQGVTLKNGNYKIHIVKQGEGLNKIARDNKVSVEEIKYWNQSKIKENTIHPGQELIVGIGNSKTSSKKNKQVAQNKNKGNGKGKGTNLKNSQYIEHTVQKGESIASLKRKYTVSMADIRKWNNLTSDKIYPGQKLQILQDPTKVNPNRPYENLNPGEVYVHTLKEGETIYSIQNAYNVSKSEIRLWNNLADNNVKAGQKLKVYKPEKKTHIVKAGETVNSIAQTYTNQRPDLMKIKGYTDKLGIKIRIWNKLQQPYLTPGQSLILYMPKGPQAGEKVNPTTTTPQNNPNTAPTTKNGILQQPKTPTKNPFVTQNTPSSIHSGHNINAFSIPVLHPVKEGENISTVSEKYNVGRSEIGYWNNRTWEEDANGSRNIKIFAGEDLLIYKPVKKTYIVRNGDDLRSIATAQVKSHPDFSLLPEEKTVAKFMKKIIIWNKLKNYKYLRPGTELTFFMPTGPIKGSGRDKSLDYIPPTIKDIKSNNVKSPNNNVKATTSGNLKSSNTAGGKITYTVQKGETMWAVANKHRVKMEQIKTWNNLPDHSVREGQKLTIYPRNNPSTVVAKGNNNNITKQPQTTIEANRGGDPLQKIGTNKPATGNPFGGGNNNNKPATGNPFGGGNNNNKPATGNPFGNNNTPQAQPQGSPFGGNNNAEPTQPTNNNPVTNNNSNTPPATSKIETNPLISTTNKVVILTGLATEIKGVSSTGRFVAFASEVKQGTLITIKNPLNEESVSAVVIGPLPVNVSNGVIVQLSPEAFKRLKTTETQVQVELKYE